MRLVLWDVDGTLVHAGRAGAEIFVAAVERELGRTIGAHEVKMGGKTDPQIALEILELAELAEDEAQGRLPSVLEHYEAELAAVEERVRREGHVMAGVAELLPRLHAHPDVVQSLLTGNLAVGARLKIAAFDLDRWIDFDVGAYGSDDHDRRNLVPVARAKVAARMGVAVDPTDVWVVGDTPRDLECALAGGARCLLVATGIFTFDELATLEADAVLRDLGDVDMVYDLLSAPASTL